MQSQIETTVTNGSPNSSKESSLRPLTPETKENGINGMTNGSATNGSKDIDSDCNPATSSPKPQNGSADNSDNITVTKDIINDTKENSKDQNGKDDNGIVNNSNHHTQQSMPSFQPDPNKSAFMTPNKNNEDFMIQQQQQSLYDQQHDMKFGKISNITNLRIVQLRSIESYLL